MAFRNQYSKHDNEAKVDEEFRNYEQFLSRLITFGADRAPKSSDKQWLWVFNDGGTMKLYVKNPKDGTYDQI